MFVETLNLKTMKILEEKNNITKGEYYFMVGCNAEKINVWLSHYSYNKIGKIGISRVCYDVLNYLKINGRNYGTGIIPLVHENQKLAVCYYIDDDCGLSIDFIDIVK